MQQFLDTKYVDNSTGRLRRAVGNAKKGYERTNTILQRVGQKMQEDVTKAGNKMPQSVEQFFDDVGEAINYGTEAAGDADAAAFKRKDCVYVEYDDSDDEDMEHHARDGDNHELVHASDLTPVISRRNGRNPKLVPSKGLLKGEPAGLMLNLNKLAIAVRDGAGVYANKANDAWKEALKKQLTALGVDYSKIRYNADGKNQWMAWWNKGRKRYTYKYFPAQGEPGCITPMVPTDDEGNAIPGANEEEAYAWRIPVDIPTVPAILAKSGYQCMFVPSNNMKLGPGGVNKILRVPFDNWSDEEKAFYRTWTTAVQQDPHIEALRPGSWQLCMVTESAPESAKTRAARKKREKKNAEDNKPKTSLAQAIASGDYRRVDWSKGYNAADRPESSPAPADGRRRIPGFESVMRPSGSREASEEPLLGEEYEPPVVPPPSRGASRGASPEPEAPRVPRRAALRQREGLPPM